MLSTFTKMFSRIPNNRVFLLTLCNFSYRQCALKSALVTMLISLSPVSRLASRSCPIRWIRGWERLPTNTTIFPQLMFRSGMLINFCPYHISRKKVGSIKFIFIKENLDLNLNNLLNFLSFLTASSTGMWNFFSISYFTKKQEEILYLFFIKYLDLNLKILLKLSFIFTKKTLLM